MNFCTGNDISLMNFCPGNDISLMNFCTLSPSSCGIRLCFNYNNEISPDYERHYL